MDSSGAWWNGATIARPYGPTPPVSIVDGKLQCLWHGKWADWKDLQDSQALADLLQKAVDSLAGMKGKGKGKEKGKSA